MELRLVDGAWLIGDARVFDGAEIEVLAPDGMFVDAVVDCVSPDRMLLAFDWHGMVFRRYVHAGVEMRFVDARYPGGHDAKA